MTWDTRPLRRLAECIDYVRIPLNAQERSERPGEIPYWGANKIQGYVDDFLVEGEIVLLGEDGAPFFDRDRPVAFRVIEPVWPNNHIHVLRPATGVDARWLAYALNDVDYSLYVDGSTRSNLTQAAMMNITRLTPSEDEQRAIADYLDRETAQIDTLIAKQQQLIATLREHHRATITRVITKGLDRHADLDQTGDPSIGAAPTHWPLCRLKHVAASIIGLTYSPDDIVDSAAEGTLVIRAGNVQHGRLTPVDPVYVSSFIPEALRLDLGDIVICARNGSARLIGKNAETTEEYVGQTWGAFMVVLRSPLNEFLRWVLNSEIFKAQTGLFSTSTINQLTSGTLNNLVLALPPAGERASIAAYLTERTVVFDRLISKVERSVELAKERRAGLITAAVTGELAVPAS